jgi:crossover junction endodeoxyribonuclease RusA
MSATEYLIRLPWPAPALWRNRRVHWGDRAKAVKKARAEARLMAQNSGLRSPIPEAVLEFHFSPPPQSRPDLQNMPDTVKAYIDGIADAMGCDDRGFQPRWPDQFSDRVKGGAVLVHVRLPTREAKEAAE